MNNKKNLDKLFKEQLKNFDVAPKDHVWENIEERLHEGNRKKRRVIPIWWRIAGIAAGLILLFAVANQVFNTSEKEGVSKDIIVDDTNINESSSPENNNNFSENDKPSEVILDNNSVEQITNTNTNSNSSVEDDENASINKNKSNTIGLDDNDNSTIASENSNRIDNKEKSDKNNSNTNSSGDDYKNLLEEKKMSIQDPLTKDAVAKTNDSKATPETNKSSQDIIKDKSEIDKILKSNESETSTTIANLNSAEKEQSDTENNTTEDNQTQEKEEEVNTIENALAEVEDTDEKEEEEEKLNRWSVSPNVAPVYFGSFGEGSPLDNQFVENTKESEINMSYGITGSYAVNKKLKIRAGINKVQLGYKTNDVLIFENSNPVARATRQIANVNLIDSMSQHSIYSARTFKFDNAPATLFTKEQGSLDQQLGFIEVPVEIEYNFIEKKIGLNLIGGFSALFLSDNDVYAVLNNGDRTRLGEASNVKDLSYTANFGIGLDYNFSKQLQFNLEPTFKYQINTFNNTSGDFNPFFLGLYTGLSFKF